MRNVAGLTGHRARDRRRMAFDSQQRDDDGKFGSGGGGGSYEHEDEDYESDDDESDWDVEHEETETGIFPTKERKKIPQDCLPPGLTGHAARDARLAARSRR